MSANILVLDNDPIYCELTSTILTKGGYDYCICANIEELSKQFALKKYDLLIAEMKLVQENNFFYLRELREHSKIPLVITTDEQIDQYFETLIKFNINQVLSKPMKSSELLQVLDNLLNPNPKKWFGLENYISDVKKLRRIEITKSIQIRPTIKAIFSALTDWQFTSSAELELILQEILTNAIYHSHGFSQQKMDRLPIELPSPYRVTIRFGANPTQFAVSVRDYKGSLTPARIMESLRIAIEQQQMLERSHETGEDVSAKILDRGRGLDLVRRLTGEYYFIIDPRKSTEVIIIHDRSFEKDDPISNLKIFELPDGFSDNC